MIWVYLDVDGDAWPWPDSSEHEEVPLTDSAQFRAVGDGWHARMHRVADIVDALLRDGWAVFLWGDVVESSNGALRTEKAMWKRLQALGIKPDEVNVEDDEQGWDDEEEEADDGVFRQCIGVTAGRPALERWLVSTAEKQER